MRVMRFGLKTLLSASLFLLLPAQGAEARDDVMARAMKDELARSMEKLQVENLEKPYFVSYRALERQAVTVRGTLGSLLSSADQTVRELNVEVRVGDYSLDNMNFLSSSFRPSRVSRMFSGAVLLPLEDNYKEIRRQIWLATDSAYKKALEDLSKKRSVLQNKTRTEEIADFSKESPLQTTDLQGTVQVDRTVAEELVRSVSSLFRETPDVFTSEVKFEVINFHTRYLNSEGGSYEKSSSYTSLISKAGTQAKDGMSIEDFVAFYGRSPEDLPDQSQIIGGVRAMALRLAELRTAPLIDLYNGPVLFEGQAAAELFAQALAPRLVAVRRPLSDDPRFQRIAEQARNPLQDRLGARVLPRFLNVTDDPTRTEYDGHVLVGGYSVDGQGVKARKTALIQRGVLTTLLSDRTPSPGLNQSSGNRRGSSLSPSNLFVTSTNELSNEQLKQELLSLVGELGKEYGVIVKRLGNGSFRSFQDETRRFLLPPGPETIRVEGAILVYKVYPDGREELIRNAETSSFSVGAFKDIVATSDNSIVHTIPFQLPFRNPMVRPSRTVVSYIVPSLLFEEVTLKRPSGEIRTLPLIASPLRK